MRMNVEEFQGKVLANLDTLGREMGEVRTEQKKQGEAIAGWKGICAEKRAELERRVSTEREQLERRVTNSRLKTVAITLTIAIPAIGLIATIVYYVVT